MIRLGIGCFVLLTGAAIASAQPATPTPDPCAQILTRATRAETTLKDWPELVRYREDNTKATAPAGNENRVVFMGDSITDSWDDPNYGGFFPGKPYFDRGISGQTTPQMLIRFRPDVLALKPKVVVILAGTNDIAGNTGPMTLSAIEDNLTSMFELAHANGIRVVLASVLPISDSDKNKGGQQIIRTSNARLNRSKNSMNG
jgi:lysophospholipase L1-like esterase